MRLKSVRIFGFKTFAERTEFSLEGGIVAVVGPNGCGKSNLVDAILWGLGEGNARSLRAQHSQDVIFNGSSKRKGVGYCEVTLLFDNEDGVLPIESPEVAVSRRLTRNGDNEYSINRRTCRQRDIYELLADSGLGRTGYSIVGQRQIDSALSASSDERRSWIDEAAGVQRYRQRKTEALRRLATAQEHLQRVADILVELETQREPLREQAEQAAQYRRIQSSLREVEIQYLVHEIDSASAELDRRREQIRASLHAIETETLRAQAADVKVTELSREGSHLDILIEQEQIKEREAIAAIERIESDIRLLEHRLKTLDEQEVAFAADREEATQRIQEVDSEVERLTLEEKFELERTLQVREEAAGFGQEARLLSEQLELAERELKHAKQREAQRFRRSTERAHLLQRRAIAERELAGIDANQGDLEIAHGAARKEWNVAVAAGERLEEKIRGLVSRELEIRAEEDRASSEARSIISEKAALEGRERGIEATIDGLEGLTQGSRAVLEASIKGQIIGEFVPVGQAVQAEPEHALAIETALGGALNDLIVPSERESKSAIQFLKTNHAGRATFQPLSLMRSPHQGQELFKLSQQPGVVGIASEIVTCPERFRPVIQSLLGRILVVENLDVALRLARTAGWSRIATLDGEIVHSSGAVTGGRQSRPGYGVLQRKADLAQIRDSISSISKRVENYYRGSEERQEVALQVGRDLKVLREELKLAERETAEARNYFRNLEDELKSSIREREKLVKELAVEIPAEPLEVEDVSSFEAMRDERLRALAEKSADSQSSRTRLIESEGRLTQAKARLEGVQRRKESALNSEVTRAQRLEAIGPEREKLLQQLDASVVRRDLGIGDRITLSSSVDTLKNLRVLKLGERETATAEAAHLRQSVTDLGQAMHQFELERTRADARRAASASRLVEEYGIVRDDLDRDSTPAAPPADAPAIVARLRRELRGMGDVNLGAVEAFERLSVRHFELSSQRDDILGGVEEIEASMRELDKLTLDKFKSTLEKVKEKFSETFVRLFEGGSGSITLTDDSDVLNAGVEIDVTLPGKRRQTLSLLSGGEQSLCTAAFLFALLQVKPSPLVVLDEVDAPLDGRNVERYSELLKDLSQSIQFIVITHNPVTIDAASTWLGVTMQEPGVSTLIPTRAPSSLASVPRTA